jgi:hypothetical protein
MFSPPVSHKAYSHQTKHQFNFQLFLFRNHLSLLWRLAPSNVAEFLTRVPIPVTRASTPDGPPTNRAPSSLRGWSRRTASIRPSSCRRKKSEFARGKMLNCRHIIRWPEKRKRTWKESDEKLETR